MILNNQGQPKSWLQSKTIWGMLGVAAFGILGHLYPDSVTFQTLFWAAVGWAGIGARDAMQ